MNEYLVAGVLFNDSRAFCAPYDVLIKQIWHVGRPHKDTADPRVCVDDYILAATRVAIVPVQPDARAVNRVENQVVAYQTTHIIVCLDQYPRQNGAAREAERVGLLEYS